ncbi:MAG TPA: site-specific integrase [Mycobacteriales bacterium]|nr:site-specific integrase [Mycobacteriales bacterium]
MTKDKSRAPNGASSLYFGKDGDWHGRVTMGVRDDGKPDRRHVRGKSKAEVFRKVRELEKARDDGTVRKPGRPWTVAQWLNHWVENIAAPVVRDNTLAGYRVAVRVHLIPGVGAHRIDKLQPEHLEKLYKRMQENGSAPATAHQAHRTIRTALNEAVRRKHLAQNPAKLAKAPRLTEEEIEPYTIEEVKRILDAAAGRRNRVRWAIALALGLRQGEALGLRWKDVDLAAGTLVVRRARQRPRYTHGCGGTCERPRAGYCPQRQAARPDTADTKSKYGRRGIGLPAELVSLLRQHRIEQNQEREVAGQLWHEGGWVFTTPTGEPVNPSSDYHDWKKLIKAADVRDGRLHDARHTAATVLLVLGVAERAVMGLMGWANTAMATRYQHVTPKVRADIAKLIDGLLWATNEENDADVDRPDGDEGSAGVPIAP